MSFLAASRIAWPVITWDRLETAIPVSRQVFVSPITRCTCSGLIPSDFCLDCMRQNSYVAFRVLSFSFSSSATSAVLSFRASPWNLNYVIQGTNQFRPDLSQNICICNTILIWICGLLILDIRHHKASLSGYWFSKQNSMSHSISQTNVTWCLFCEVLMLK